jgi:hypothetical protein
MILILGLARPLLFAVFAEFADALKMQESLQITAFAWCRLRGLNPRPSVYKTAVRHVA